MIEMTDLDKQILLNKIELYAEYLALADRIKGETCLINDFKTKCWLIKKSTKHDLKAQELFKQIEEKILRGRDDLNSNKTPKEFCKDKERNY